MGYICWKCGTNTIAESLILSNRLYGEVDDMNTWFSGKNPQDVYGKKKDYFIIWFCLSCNTINLHYSLEKEPISITPVYDSQNTLKKLEKCEDENVVRLFYDFIKCYTLKINSAAILLGRKILMHLAVLETKCKKNENFTYYVDEIRKSGILGNKWNEKLDVIRRLGNEENHEIKICSDEELETVKDIIVGLIDNIYL